MSQSEDISTHQVVSFSPCPAASPYEVRAEFEDKTVEFIPIVGWAVVETEFYRWSTDLGQHVPHAVDCGLPPDRGIEPVVLWDDSVMTTSDLSRDFAQGWPRFSVRATRD